MHVSRQLRRAPGGRAQRLAGARWFRWCHGPRPRRRMRLRGLVNKLRWIDFIIVQNWPEEAERARAW